MADGNGEHCVDDSLPSADVRGVVVVVVVDSVITTLSKDLCLRLSLVILLLVPSQLAEKPAEDHLAHPCTLLTSLVASCWAAYCLIWFDVLGLLIVSPLSKCSLTLRMGPIWGSWHV